TMLKVWWIKIDIHSIKRIFKTNNPLSSPALSLDRIAIVYNKYDEVLISPKFKKEFVDVLLKINPSIIVEI
ncbi:MAG: PH domain-containing protein, partial [Flavobacterium sp.]|nr:PH domain-containing protein [Flavobacterium sp.]